MGVFSAISQMRRTGPKSVGAPVMTAVLNGSLKYSPTRQCWRTRVLYWSWYTIGTTSLPALVVLNEQTSVDAQSGLIVRKLFDWLPTKSNISPVIPGIWCFGGTDPPTCFATHAIPYDGCIKAHIQRTREYIPRSNNIKSVMSPPATTIPISFG